MSRILWLKECFDASIKQGFGKPGGYSSDMGQSIFEWKDCSTLHVFENGFYYGSNPSLKIFYDDIEGLELLDLRSLMHAQRMPYQNVEFSVKTKNETYFLKVPLILYTTLSSVLFSIVEMKQKP